MKKSEIFNIIKLVYVAFMLFCNHSNHETAKKNEWKSILLTIKFDDKLMAQNLIILRFFLEKIYQQ